MVGPTGQDPRSRDNLYVKGLPLDYTKDGRWQECLWSSCHCLKSQSQDSQELWNTTTWASKSLQLHPFFRFQDFPRCFLGSFSEAKKRTRGVWLQEDLEEIFKPYGVVKRCRCRLLRCGNGWKVVEVFDLKRGRGCGQWFSKMKARKLFCLVGRNFWGILASAWDVENALPEGFSQNVSGTL